MTTNLAIAKDPPAQLYVHCATASALIDLGALLQLPATCLALSKGTSTLAAFGDITIRVERFFLQATKKLMIAGEMAPLGEFRVAESKYHVRGRVGVSAWPTGLRPKKRALWKVSLENKSRRVIYSPQSIADWSLTAMEMEQGLEPTLAVSLEK